MFDWVGPPLNGSIGDDSIDISVVGDMMASFVDATGGSAVAGVCEFTVFCTVELADCCAGNTDVNPPMALCSVFVAKAVAQGKPWDAVESPNGFDGGGADWNH